MIAIAHSFPILTIEESISKHIYEFFGVKVDEKLREISTHEKNIVLGVLETFLKYNIEFFDSRYHATYPYVQIDFDGKIPSHMSTYFFRRRAVLNTLWRILK